ncbi:hypothetical protein BH10CYA1_BH10CYA1_04740 [soil metagenome]
MKLPDRWIKFGSSPEQYDMGVDEAVLHNVTISSTIRFASDEEPSGYGSLTTTLPIEKYLDKRVRMTAFVKTEHADWAGLWMRVDGPNPDQPLGFDNMSTRQIKNTTEWKRYEVVLDVPGNAKEITYGALLTGKGQVWFAEFNFEEVGNDVASTVKKSRKATART